MKLDEKQFEALSIDLIDYKTHLEGIVKQLKRIADCLERGLKK